MLEPVWWSPLVEAKPLKGHRRGRIMLNHNNQYGSWDYALWALILNLRSSGKYQCWCWPTGISMSQNPDNRETGNSNVLLYVHSGNLLCKCSHIVIDLCTLTRQVCWQVVPHSKAPSHRHMMRTSFVFILICVIYLFVCLPVCSGCAREGLVVSQDAVPGVSLLTVWGVRPSSFVLPSHPSNSVGVKECISAISHFFSNQPIQDKLNRLDL